MYSDNDFRIVKPILNKIRKYPAKKILAFCINKIRYAESDPDSRYGRYQPWSLLLLMKWTLLYGDLQGGYAQEELGETELHGLLSDISILSEELETNSMASYEEKEWFLFFRKCSFQQFPFREFPHRSRYARQSLLFGRLQKSDRLRTLFFDRVGIPMEHALELGLMLVGKFYAERQPFVTEDWFQTVVHRYPANTVRLFLQRLSRDFGGIRQYLTEMYGPDNHPPVVRFELSEMSPLKRFPLYQEGQKYYCYSRNLLLRALEHNLYDTLRFYEPQILGNDFGKGAFEEYVGQAARHTNLPVICEYDLLTALGQNGKLVDYLIVDDETHIFIDAKAVEITYIGEVSEDPDDIIGRIDSSVMKGINQAYSLAQRLDKVTHVGSLPLGKPSERYLLIVTYKDMYLGCGRDFYNYLAKDQLDQIPPLYAGKTWIPFENIYTVSIEDFDLLVQAVHQRRIGLSEFLRNTVAADATCISGRRRFVLRQHLHDMLGDLDNPTYLNEEFKELVDRARSKLH